MNSADDIKNRDENQRQRTPNRGNSGTGQQSDSRERHLDKTIEDSFPASDPPSTDPNPDGQE